MPNGDFSSWKCCCSFAEICSFIHNMNVISYNVTQTVQHNNDFLLTLILLPLTVYSLNFHYTFVRSFAFFPCRIEDEFTYPFSQFQFNLLKFDWGRGWHNIHFSRALRFMNTAWPIAVMRCLIYVNNKFRIVANCDNGSINRFYANEIWFTEVVFSLPIFGMRWSQWG